MKLHMQAGLSPGHNVLDGDSAPSAKGAQPQFSVHICCGHMAGWIKMPLAMELGLGPGDFVLDGDRAPSPKRPPLQFSAHIYCDQTAGWIKMVLGKEVGLGPGHIVMDGHRTPLPNFGSVILWPNGWMHQNATWYGGRPQPRGLCVRWGPSLLLKKGAEPPNFRLLSIVAKRPDGSRYHLVRR